MDQSGFGARNKKEIIVNEVIQTILDRRSVRAYQPTPLKKADMEQILEAGINAPSGNNTQAWHFLAIMNAETLAQFSADIQQVIRELPEDTPGPFLQSYRKRVLEGPFHFFYQAPAFVIITGKPDAITVEQDCAIAAQNLMLAARSLGIASCWIHTLVFLNGQPGMQRVIEKLGAPAGNRVYSCVALGYATDGFPAAPPRKPGSVTLLA